MIWENELAATGTLVIVCLAIIALTVLQCVKVATAARVSITRIHCGVPEPYEDRSESIWRVVRNTRIVGNTAECPRCRNADIEPTGNRFIGDTAQASFRCNTCGCQFTHDYEYISTMLEGGDD